MIAGELVEANENGEVEVSQETARLLLSDKYSFMGWSANEGNDIKKVEVSEPIIVEKGDPIKKPIIEEPKTPAEIIEEEQANDDLSIEDIINKTESFNELKEIAKGLDFPENEWSGYKRADYFKNYLLKKLS